MAFNIFWRYVICAEFLFTISTYAKNARISKDKTMIVLFSLLYFFRGSINYRTDLTTIKIIDRFLITKKYKLCVPNHKLRTNNYLITHLNNFSFPLNGGYLIAGSNQVGVFITDFLWLKVSNEYLP